ncbi:beta-ketoacyl-[acyl-carrier-protein] synthase family protein [Luteimonas sp. SJ-92]|uniref:Nodulation protein E n=1 Tax=Luteimonas salinisoli TaxID=2752307 RepID=A0A853JGQ2_9GAMM|nr:beta-ketoacyl-[acyl-carrier-protein] synthase family protein [Luteimonas salinisoli]NZA27618.1 beta-ketoacyl-[acyl-carrier-protein] synthase family protein [Luteimonas salinisoli]
MSLQRVAITGLGILSPIGLDAAQALESLRAGTSGIRLIQAPPIAKSFAAGVIPHSFEEHFTKLERPFLDRCQHLAILAARQALQEAGLPEQLAGYGQRAGVYYGNVNGGAATTVAWTRDLHVEGKAASRPFTAMAIMGNAGAAQVAIRHKILGPVITNASACASSGVAIGEAGRAIAHGYADVILAGGAEAPLTAGVFGTFDGTRAMSAPDPEDPSRTCKPFSTARSGLVIGEGAAWLVLESEKHALARGARIHAYLTGYGISSDSHHIGMPETNGQVAALEAVLAHAGLQPSDIDYINAHATATRGGDKIEAESIRRVFGADRGAPRVSSTKAVHGHLIGAASALELSLTILAMNDKLLPASAFIGEADPQCELNHVGPRPVPAQDIRHALSFSCGFGGTNAALVVSTKPPDR